MIHRRTLAAALVATLTSACSTTATVHRHHGPAYEAKITGSEPGVLFVEADDGREYRVPAEEVRDIDHPGNVLALLGGLSLASAGLISANTAQSNADQTGNQIAAGFYAILGVAMLAPGLAIWMRSKNAASDLQPGLPAAAYPAEPRPLAR